MLVQKNSENICEITTFLSLIICSLFSGGLSSQYAAVPNILFIIALAVRRRNIVVNINTFAIVIMLITGIISVFTALGDKQNALHEFEKTICFILAFYVGSAICEKRITRLVAYTGFAIAVLGILGYCNIIRADEFVFNDRHIYRLQSAIRYANTAAVLLGSSYFMFLNLYDETKKYLRYMASCVLLAMFLTISKAEIPIFIFVGILSLIFEKRYIRDFILQSTICIIFAVIVIFLASCHYYSLALLSCIACVAFSGGFRAKKIKKEKTLLITWLSVGTLGVLLVFLASAVLKINILKSFLVRLDYMSDALTLVFKSPYTGIGPGAWKYYQYIIQTSEYGVTYIHNGWLQLLVENGFVFTVFFLLLYIISFVNLIKKRKTLFASVLLLVMLHSLVDINLSFSLIMMILGLIIGNSTKEVKKIPRFAAASVILVCTVISLYMLAEYTLRNSFEKAYINKDYSKALFYAERLEKMCPYDSDLKISIAALNGKDSDAKVEEAVRLSPYDKDILLSYITYTVNTKAKNEDYYKLFIKYTNLAPKQEKTYNDINTLSYKAYQNNLISKDDLDKINNYTEWKRKKENVKNMTDRSEVLHEIIQKGVKK